MAGNISGVSYDEACKMGPKDLAIRLREVCGSDMVVVRGGSEGWALSTLGANTFRPAHKWGERPPVDLTGAEHAFMGGVLAYLYIFRGAPPASSDASPSRPFVPTGCLGRPRVRF